MWTECHLEVRKHGALCAFMPKSKIPMLYKWNVLTWIGRSLSLTDTGHLPLSVELMTHSKTWGYSVCLRVRHASVMTFSIMQSPIICNLWVACAVFGRSSEQHGDKERLDLLSLLQMFEDKPVPGAVFCSQERTESILAEQEGIFFKE